MNVTNHFERTFGQWTATHAPFANLRNQIGRRLQTVTTGCRVGGHNTIESVFDHLIDLLLTQIGGYFQQNGPILVLTTTEIDQPLQQLLEVVLVLQAGQIGNVRTADIDYKIVDIFV